METAEILEGDLQAFELGSAIHIGTKTSPVVQLARMHNGSNHASRNTQEELADLFAAVPEMRRLLLLVAEFTDEYVHSGASKQDFVEVVMSVDAVNCVHEFVKKVLKKKSSPSS